MINKKLNSFEKRWLSASWDCWWQNER